MRNTGQGTATTDAIQVTKYYYLGSSRVAMRRSAPTGTEVTYLHTDHLGTVSIATNASGQEMARTLNMPYGSVRWSSGTLPTDYGFTGMKDTGLGSVYLHARYYSSWVGRFVSADTMVPGPGNPQSLNRFAYTANNPLKFTDPTGHDVDCGISDSKDCRRRARAERAKPFTTRYVKTGYGWFDTGHFGGGNPENVIQRVAELVQNGGGEFPVGSCGNALGLCNYEYYRVSAEATEDQIIGIALGIYMDRTRRHERWQGYFPFTTSSFSIEDLPTHYLSFVAAVNGLPLKRGQESYTFAYYADILGPATESEEGPPQFVTTGNTGADLICGLFCTTATWTLGGPSSPLRNYEFAPLIQDVNGNWHNVPWPSELTITPIDSGPHSWEFTREVSGWGIVP